MNGYEGLKTVVAVSLVAQILSCRSGLVKGLLHENGLDSSQRDIILLGKGLATIALNK